MSSLITTRGLPGKISFFGHFGSPNPGNESTLIATLAGVRSRCPDSKFECICTNPEAVVARDGIDAVPITTRDGRIWDRDVPLARRTAMAFVGVGAELAQYGRAFAVLKETNTLVVAGTGVVTDAYGLSAWGPYSQLKWTLMAKLRRCRVLFVSVGAGPIDGSVARLLVKATMSLADYRSYRDQASRDWLARIGFRSDHDAVYPDLAFNLPEALLPRDRATSDRPRRVVGLGLMEYAGKYATANPRPETYTAYLESLAEFALWLLDHDYDIRLLLGDADTIAIDGFRSALRARREGYDEQRVIANPIASVEDVLTELAASDLVVATRLHNVLLAMLLDKPVIAISFHHKCASLMRRMRLPEYCHDIHQMDTDRLIAQFRQLEHNHSAVKRTIAQGLQEARAALDEQFDLLFGEPVDGVGSTDGPRDRRLAQRFANAQLGLGERVWQCLPSRVRDLRPVRAYGERSHELVCRGSDREMYVGTLFLRNRPALEMMRRRIHNTEQGSRVKIAVMGCSIGVEVYSILWTLRRDRPDLEFDVYAVDISQEVVDVARRGVYSPAESEMVNAAIFDGLTDLERREMFDWNGDEGAIKPWLRDGITWNVGDAGDPTLITILEPQDLVIANNFLCHMPPPAAERCLRNLAQLVRPGGHLFVTGVDLDVRTRVAVDLDWEPISELRAEIHDGDQLVRSDWPWRWWGLEPLDQRRPDWETRYTAVFRVKTEPVSAQQPAQVLV